MEALLSAKQVQEVLHIDRSTVYRMLKDGRLSGVKVGNQWRFPQAEVDEMLSGAKQLGGRGTPVSTAILPLHCLQPVQDVFAEIAEVGAVTTRTDGQPLTSLSNSCEFCNLIRSSKKGHEGCIASWRKLAEEEAGAPRFVSCHAGLQYARAPIEVGGSVIAVLVAGQFHAEAPIHEEERQRVGQLAESYAVDESRLQKAAEAVEVLDERKVAKLSKWLEAVAATFEKIGTERADLMSRLRQIAEMSALREPLASA